MAQHQHWYNTGEPLEQLDHISTDQSWIKYLCQPHTLISAVGFGSSYWSQSGKIDIKDGKGEPHSFFIKLSKTRVGQLMVEGEFKSIKELHQVNANMVPKPIAYGTFETGHDCHFFLCEFVDFHDKLADIVDLCKSIATLHRKSMDHSINGVFGFQVTTCNGAAPQHTDWSPSWEKFYIETLKDAYRQEKEAQGENDEIERLLPALYEKVCPRLLRPFETEGRKLRPCLSDGDLWGGNVGILADDGTPFISDAAAIWGHNEYEFHIWRPTRYGLGKTFLLEYFNHFPPSPPEEDWDDRNLLYSLVADLHVSILFTQTKMYRDLLIISMNELVAKFPNGYEGPAHHDDDGSMSKEWQGNLLK